MRSLLVGFGVIVSAIVVVRAAAQSLALGREAFIGYYVGVIATWFVFVCVGKLQRVAQPLRR